MPGIDLNALAASLTGGGQGSTGSNPLLNPAGNLVATGTQLLSSVGGSAIGSALSGAGTGAALGTIVPGVGNLVGGVAGGVVGLLSNLFGGTPGVPRANDSKVTHRPTQFNTSYSPYRGADSVNEKEAIAFNEIATAYPGGAFFEDVLEAFYLEMRNNGRTGDKVIQYYTDDNRISHGKWALDEWFKLHPELKPSVLLTTVQSAQLPVVVNQNPQPASANPLPQVVTQTVLPSSVKNKVSYLPLAAKTSLGAQLSAGGSTLPVQNLTIGEVLGAGANGAIDGVTAKVLESDKGKEIKAKGAMSWFKDNAIPFVGVSALLTGGITYLATRR